MKILTEIDYLSCILIDWKAGKAYRYHIHARDRCRGNERWVEVNG